MKESVVIFFFAGNNHISNVETLQSIYTQDYDSINLIICNDSVYGFESERLLANFEERKSEHIQQVYFLENLYPMGELDCQRQFWDRMDDAYYYVIHAGEKFTSPTVLRTCVEELKKEPSADAILAGAELWSDDFDKLLQVKQAVKPELQGAILSGTDAKWVCRSEIRDCMVLYRVPALRIIRLQLDQHQTHVGQHLIMRLLRSGGSVMAKSMIMCKYSEKSTSSTEIPVPTEYGSEILRNIENLLQESEQTPIPNEKPLFSSGTQVKKPARKRNLHHILHKLSTFAKIRSYAVFALLMFIAAALFLHLDTELCGFLGVVFMIGAILASLLTVGMLACNLFYKRYPQRLVMHNGNS